jgi:hypothetical protein
MGRIVRTQLHGDGRYVPLLQPFVGAHLDKTTGEMMIPRINIEGFATSLNQAM